MRFKLKTLLTLITLVALATIFVVSHLKPTASGEFLVKKDLVSIDIRELAHSLEWIRPETTDNEFKNALAAAGLKKRPDFWKDCQYYWYFDENLKPTTNSNRRYRISIHYLPHTNSKITVYDAAISKITSGDGQIETIWKIQYLR